MRDKKSAKSTAKSKQTTSRKKMLEKLNVDDKFLLEIEEGRNLQRQYQQAHRPDACCCSGLKGRHKEYCC